MSSTFEELFDDGASAALLDTFGEDVTYLPTGEASQSIKAIVTRRKPGPADGADASKTYIIEVQISRTAALGRENVNLGVDRIQLSPWPGQAVASLMVADHVPELTDGSFWGLLLR